MKAKVIITLLVCAVVTLSFTFSSGHKSPVNTKTATSESSTDTFGGLSSVDPIK